MAYDFDRVINRWQTSSVKWDGMVKRYGTREATPMWVADMDFQSPPEVIEALKKRAEHGVYGYTVQSEEFNGAIVQWMAKRHGFAIDANWIVHTPGVVAGLSFIVEALTEPGDKVIIQPPVYHPFQHVLQEHGRTIVENQLLFDGEQYTIDFDDLEEKAKGAKMLILCSPHNPVGRVWTREELTRLGDICLHNGVFVIADEIHSDLIYQPYQHTPFASISEAFADNSITCIAPSKTFNLAGLNTAILLIPNTKLRHRVQSTLGKHHVGGLNVFGATALEAAYKHGANWLDELLVYLKENVAYLTDYLRTHAPQIKVVQPQGTYLVWLDCRELGLEAKELDEFMLKKGKLALNDGRMFGSGGEGFQRMNIGCPRALLKQGLETLAAAVQSL